MARLENLSDEVTEGRSNARVEEEQVERGGWIVNSRGEVGGGLCQDIERGGPGHQR